MFDTSADRGRAIRLVTVSRETLIRLDRFVDLLLRWQKTTNLISPSTIPSLWVRHVADSMQLLALAANAKTWLDLGSGGGFPGFVIACALADVPGAVAHLTESNGKKVAFLREAIRETGAAAVVHAGRIEDILSELPSNVDIVTARALAPLKELLQLVEPTVKMGAKALLLKGQDIDAELTEATKYWNIKSELVPSITDRSGRILIVHEVTRRKQTEIELKVEKQRGRYDE